MRQHGTFACLLAVAVGCCMIHQSYSKEWSKEEKEQMMADMKSCAESTKFEIEKMKGSKENAKEMISSPEGQCFVKCMTEKMDVLDSNGCINEVGCQAWIAENEGDLATGEKMVAIVKECKAAEQPGDPCETAAKNIECMQQKFKAAGIKDNMGIP